MNKEITMPDEETKDIIPAGTTPADLLSILVQRGADLATLEKFMDLKDREEANQARKAYVIAMTQFKANPPEILKKAKVSYGQTHYDYASLDHVSDEINKALSRHGLFASWSQSQENSAITVTCKITHEGGHSEKTSLTAAPDKSGAKNDIQSLGSTITYLQRYTILALTGLAAKGMDDDGKGTEVEYINDTQLSSLTDMINSKEADEVKFLKYMKIESLDKMPAKDFGRAMTALKAKKAPTRQPGE